MYELTPRGKEVPRIIVYHGAISERSWYSPENLIRAYRAYSSRYGHTGLRGMTRAGREGYYRFWRCNGLPEAELKMFGADSLEEVYALLRSASCACLPFRDDRCELAAGLLVVCNRQTGGASRLIRKQGLGGCGGF